MMGASFLVKSLTKVSCDSKLKHICFTVLKHCFFFKQNNENICVTEDDWSDNDTDELEKITNHRITKNQKNGQFLEFLTKWDGEDGVTWDCGRTVATDAPTLVAKHLIEKK